MNDQSTSAVGTLKQWRLGYNLLNLMVFGSAWLILAACGSDGESEGASSAGPFVNSQSLIVVTTPEVTPPVEANTPDNFRGSFALARLALKDPKAYAVQRKLMLASLADACDNQYDRNSETTKWNGCRAAAQVKEEFFLGEGPTDIAGLTAKVDSRLEDVFRNTDWAYMPCFDSANTAGGTYKVLNSADQTYSEATYGAYTNYAFASATTFQDGTTFDTGLTGYLSCYNSLGMTPENYASWVAFGRKDGNYYIHEGQGKGIGSMAKLSSNGDMELFMSVGTMPSSYPTDWTSEYAVLNASSSGLAHLKSFADSGILEMTVVGMGPGPCGTHIISNGKLLFINYNYNEIGACFATDNGIGQASKRNDNGVRAYDASIADYSYCLDVSDTTKITAFDTVEPCTDQGLSADSFSLTSLTSQVLKPANALYMYSSDPKDLITEVTYIEVNPEIVEGSDKRILALDVDSETNSKIETKCSSAAADQKDVSLSYSMSVKGYLDAEVADAESNPNKSPDFDATTYRATLLNSLTAATGASAATLKFSVAASAGGLKWADFDLKVSLKLNDSEIGSGSYTETTDHTVGAQPISLTADLTGLTETSALTLKGTGTLKIECTNSSNTTTTAASVRLGYPRLSYTEIPSE